MSKVQLYACLGSGNCYKPWLAMHQLGIGFDLHMVDVLRGDQNGPAYRAVNPLGVVPYLISETGQGLGESNAMLWYLCDGTALMPQTRSQRAAALQWMFFEQSKLEPYISPARFFTTILPEKAEIREDDITRWQEQAMPGLAHLDGHLANTRFMLGEAYSVADIAVFGYTHVLDEAGLPPEDFPNVMRWIADVAATDGFQPLARLGTTGAMAA